jgi:AcrR family transcriptional regulator
LTLAEPTPRRRRFPGVRAPKPVLTAEAASRLTGRQREVLDALEGLVVASELSELTMVEIAAQLNCSLRTLYDIAPSRDELVLMVVDRRLHRIGRTAVEAMDASLSPLDALRAYLGAVSEAVQPTAVAFTEEFANLPGAPPILDAHEGYVIAVTRSLLERAVAEDQIRRVDTAALAHVLGGLGREFARPEVAERADASPKATADAITEIILRGLVRA